MNTPILQIQQDGRKAEIVVDTGHALRGGKTWRAFAKVFCPNVFIANLVAERLKRRLGEAVEAARRESYQLGYEHGARRSEPLREFSPEL